MIIAPKSEPVIISSSVAEIEAGVAVYDPLTSYQVGAVVQVNAPTHRKYKAVQATTGNDPVLDVNPVTGIGTYWLDDGATNYYRAFDELGSSKCISTSINYKFSASDIDVLMLDGLKSSTVRVKLINENNASVLLDETFETESRDVYDWYDWTYANIEPHRSFYKLLPMVFNSSIEIWIEGTGFSPEVGHIVFGHSKSYGLSLADPKPVSSRRSVSAKSRDGFGEIVTRRKARYKRMSITCLLDSIAVDTIEDRLEAIVDTPCIFVGDERDGGYKSLLIYGEMRDHDTPIGISKTSYKLEVEGYA